MLETLYQTDVPQELDRAEWYQPHIDLRQVDGKTVFFVMEKHRWYSEGDKQPYHVVVTFQPEEHMTEEEARVWYDDQVQSRAKAGFVHSFSWDPYSPVGFKYRRITP